VLMFKKRKKINFPVRIAHILNKCRVTASTLDRIRGYDGSKFKVYLIGWWDKTIDRELLNIPSNVEIFPLGKYPAPLRFIKLVRYLIRNDTHIIHTRHARTSFYSRFASKLAGCLNVFEDGAGHQSYSWGSRCLFMLNVFMCDRVVTVSKFVYDSYNWLEKWLVPEKKVDVIYYGIDISAKNISTGLRNETRQLLHISTNDLVLIFTGRFVPVKNLDYLIEFFYCVVEKGLKVHLIMVGDGPLRHSLENQVDQHGLNEIVHFTGLVGRHKVYEYLAVADGMIMTSFSEGHSVSLTEAMHMGLFSILSEIPSFIETMGDGKGALFLDITKSPERNSAKFCQVLKTPSLIRNMQQNAYRLAKIRYDYSKMMLQYESLYLKVLGL